MTNVFDEIPIIDLCAISGNYETLQNNKEIFKNVSEEFGKAMSSIGFAYVRNHGIDMTLVNEVHQLSQKFFNLPIDVKTKYNKPDTSVSFHGYGGPGDELHQSEVYSIELHEFFDFWGPMQFTDKEFPVEVPGWKESFDKLRQHCVNLCKKLLRCMAQYLQLSDEELFNKNHSCMNNSSVRTHTQFRAINYPKVNIEQNDIPRSTRLGEHADWGTITLLFQDMIGGLEVKTAEGNWIQAVPIEDTIIINGGELLEIWSGAVFPATIHRVRLLDQTRQENRQSLVYFLAPDAQAEVKTLECPKISQNFNSVIINDPVNAWDYYSNRIQATSSGY